MPSEYTPPLSELADYVTRSFEEVVLPWANRSWRRKWAARKLYRRSKRAEHRRERVEKDGGFPVPPIVLISPTSACNLSCERCYAGNYQTPCHLSPRLLHSLIKQAKELGCFFFIMVGGEPFLHNDLLDVLARHKEAVFLIFTNGTLLFGDMVKRVSRLLNVIPIVSLGDRSPDRELGVHWREPDALADGICSDRVAEMSSQQGGASAVHFDSDIEKALKRLNQLDAFYGFSVVVTKKNLSTVQTVNFLDERIAEGCRIGFYVEYIPVGRNPDPTLCLSQSQRRGLREWVKVMRTRRPTFLAQFPNDEEYFGGCMAAGKGLVHITAEGYMEPCPAIHKATDNIRESSFRQCLNSLFFESIRTSSEKLSSGHLPCKLLEGSCLTMGMMDCLGATSTEDSHLVLNNQTSIPVNHYES